MSTLPILHHYPASPFSEKVRACLGFKGMDYRSVRIPAVMPKPDVLALTGGYRRTPLLQLGKHVYCDTALICRVLDRLTPEPPLHGPPGAEVVAQWADGPLFDVAVGLAGRPTKVDTIIEMMLPHELQAFAEDRKAMREAGRRHVPHFETARAHLPVYLGRVEAMLSPGPYLLGEAASVADFAVYHCLWFVQLLNPQLLPEAGPVTEWMARIAAIGHGQASEMSGADALAVSAAGESSPVALPQTDEAGAVLIGARVAVRPDDWGRDPVEGELIACGEDELVLSRTDPRAGEVHVHFPRVGYELRPA